MIPSSRPKPWTSNTRHWEPGHRTQPASAQMGGFYAATMCIYAVSPLDLRQQAKHCPYKEAAPWTSGMLTLCLKRLRPFLASLTAGAALSDAWMHCQLCSDPLAIDCCWVRGAACHSRPHAIVQGVTLSAHAPGRFPAPLACASLHCLCLDS